MVTRISGTLATFAFSLALAVLLHLGIEVYDDTFNEFPPPTFTALLFLLAPVGWLGLVNPLLFAAWYWLLSGEDPPPCRSLIVHIFVVVFSAMLLACGLGLGLYLTSLNGHVEPTPGRWTVNVLITGGLAFAVWRSWMRNRPVGKASD